jgi:RimJ/RimL family protein N-acetyltransferase
MMAILDMTNKRKVHTLQTERLLLRAAQPSDLDDLFEIFSDEDVMRYWYWCHSYYHLLTLLLFQTSLY